VVEEKTEIMNNILTDARYLLSLISTGSKSEIVAHADDFLLFLNHMSDFAKTHPKLTVQIQSLSEIVYGLESNPEETICQAEVQARLCNFFNLILK